MFLKEDILLKSVFTVQIDSNFGPEIKSAIHLRIFSQNYYLGFENIYASRSGHRSSNESGFSQETITGGKKNWAYNLGFW